VALRGGHPPPDEEETVLPNARKPPTMERMTATNSA
jgi:hypothetical protein